MITRNIHIIDIISEVVDSLRDAAVITGITDNLDNTYTITTSDTGELANDDYINITDTLGYNFDTWKVSNLVTDTSFDISNQVQETGIAIPLTFGVWKSNKPYFHFEKFQGEANFLTLLNKDPDYRFQKFPLIFLLLDITEERTKTNINTNLTLYFITKTDATKQASWRHTNTFKATLIPLMNNFLAALADSIHSVPQPRRRYEYTYTEKYYLGSISPDQNSLNQAVDAIEIVLPYTYQQIDECFY